MTSSRSSWVWPDGSPSPAAWPNSAGSFEHVRGSATTIFASVPPTSIPMIAPLMDVTSRKTLIARGRMPSDECRRALGGLDRLEASPALGCCVQRCGPSSQLATAAAKPTMNASQASRESSSGSHVPSSWRTQSRSVIGNLGARGAPIVRCSTQQEHTHSPETAAERPRVSSLSDIRMHPSLPPLKLLGPRVSLTHARREV